MLEGGAGGCIGREAARREGCVGRLQEDRMQRGLQEMRGGRRCAGIEHTARSQASIWPLELSFLEKDGYKIVG